MKRAGKKSSAEEQKDIMSLESSRGVHGVTALLSVLVLTAVIFPACSDQNQPSLALDAAIETHDLPDFIASLTPEGWSLDEKVHVFSAHNLYERINGRAELYLSYDVISMTTATFVKGDTPGEFLELSIFDMGNPLKAFGIFSIERSPGEPPLPLGRLGYRSDANMYVWKGAYYIVVVSSRIQEEMGQITLDLASKVTDALPASNEPVWGISAFPRENLVVDTIRYFHVDAMGLDFMPNTYTAEYQLDEGAITAFISRKDSPEAAAATVTRYTEYSDRYGRGRTLHGVDGGNLILCDMEGKFDVIFDKGRLVGGVTSVEDPNTALEFAEKFYKSLN